MPLVIVGVSIMNPLWNPSISLPLLKSIISDPKRLQKLKPDQIHRYKDKSFKKMIKYAYQVPLYHQKYKKAGIHPADIKGINDITKIPFITKDDIKTHFPDNILPTSYNKKKSHVICTGGTTGKPLCIYTDFYTIAKSSFPMMRELSLLGFKNLTKIKFAHIGNFNPYRIDLVAEQHFQKYLRFLLSKKNTLNIDVNNPVSEIMEKINQFKPDVIMTYPATFQHLAYLKRRGKGKQVNPSLCWTGGAILDEYTRSYVEDAFQCRLLNIYPSVEAGADIAFECKNGTWHVHDDFFHLEAIDENNNIVSEGKRGHIVITRLWGRGTPIIRYNGMDDWVKLKHEEDCSCGLNTTVIDGGVEGRKRANIILPNGKIFPPGAFCFITPVLNRLNTFKVKQYQIIQQELDEIEVLLVIDRSLRHVGPSVKRIMEDIKKIYQEKTGQAVTITIKEVDEIIHPKDRSKPPPIVISHVSQDEGYKTLSN